MILSKNYSEAFFYSDPNRIIVSIWKTGGVHMKMLAKKKKDSKERLTNFQEVNFDDRPDIFCFFFREQTKF